MKGQFSQIFHVNAAVIVQITDDGTAGLIRYHDG
jgi:hypothetical protein